MNKTCRLGWLVLWALSISMIVTLPSTGQTIDSTAARPVISQVAAGFPLNFFRRKKKIKEPATDPFIAAEVDAQTQLAPQFQKTENGTTDPDRTPPRTRRPNVNGKLPSLPYPWPAPIDSRNFATTQSTNQHAKTTAPYTIGDVEKLGARRGAEPAVRKTPSLNRSPLKSQTRPPARSRIDFQPSPSATTTWSRLFPAAEKMQKSSPQAHRDVEHVVNLPDHEGSTRRTRPRPKTEGIATQPSTSQPADSLELPQGPTPTVPIHESSVANPQRTPTESEIPALTQPDEQISTPSQRTNEAQKDLPTITPGQAATPDKDAFAVATQPSPGDPEAVENPQQQVFPSTNKKSTDRLALPEMPTTQAAPREDSAATTFEHHPSVSQFPFPSAASSTPSAPQPETSQLPTENHPSADRFPLPPMQPNVPVAQPAGTPQSPSPQIATQQPSSPESALSKSPVNATNPAVDFPVSPQVEAAPLINDSAFPLSDDLARPGTTAPPSASSIPPATIPPATSGPTATDKWLSLPADPTLAETNLRPATTGARTPVQPPPAATQTDAPNIPKPAGRGQWDESSKVLAIVGNQTILAGDVLGQINEMLKPYEDQVSSAQLDEQRQMMVQRLLPRLVENKMVFQHFLREGGPDKKPIPPEQLSQIEQRVYELFRDKELPKLIEKAGVKDAAELDNTLRGMGSSLEKQRRFFMEKSIASEMVRRNVQTDSEISHDEMLEYYYEHIDEFTTPNRARWEQLTARFDKYKTKQDALQAITAMGNAVYKNHENLADVARRMSSGPTAALGGQHDWTTKGSLVSTKLDEAIFELPVQGLSVIITDDDGYHIVRVIERQAAGKIPFQEVQDKIKIAIRKDRFAGQVQEYLAKLRKETPVTTAFDAPSSVQIASPKKASGSLR